jgi:hypothetical protein
MFSGVMTLAVKSSAASALISLLSQSGRPAIRDNCTITKLQERHRVLAFESVFRFEGPLIWRRCGGRLASDPILPQVFPWNFSRPVFLID